MDVVKLFLNGVEVEVCSDGRIYLLPKKYVTSKKLLRLSDEVLPRIRFTVDGKRFYHSAARIVCLAFHGRPEKPTSIVKYRDGNARNLSSENVYWSSVGGISLGTLRSDDRSWMIKYCDLLLRCRGRSGVYFIKDLVNSMVYIGSSKDLYKRLSTHMKSLSAGTHFNSRLQRCFDKHGSGSFVFGVYMFVDVVDGDVQQVLCDFEESAMDDFGGLDSGRLFNFKTPKSFVFSKELKAEISKKCSGKLNGNFGNRYVWSEETKELARAKGWKGRSKNED